MKAAFKLKTDITGQDLHAPDFVTNDPPSFERRAQIVKVARIAVPDLVSNSYFPAIAAIALDYFQHEGLQVTNELIFPNYRAYEALRDGGIDFVAAPAHVALRAFPRWQGCKLLAALAQGMYWLLVMRSDFAVAPGDVDVVKGRTIGAAPMVELGLKQLLIDSGIDLLRDRVQVVGVPGTNEPGISFGVAAHAPWKRARSTASGPTPWEPKRRYAMASGA